MRLGSLSLATVVLAIGCGTSTGPTGPGGGDDDVLKLINTLAQPEISVTTVEPGGKSTTVTLPTAGGAIASPTHTINVSFDVGDVYTFTARIPSFPTVTKGCTVTSTAVGSGAAEVKFYVETGNTIVIECGSGLT